MNRSRHLSRTFLPFFLLTLVGCANEGEEVEFDALSYALDIEPILTVSCAPCHTSAMPRSANLDLALGVGYESLVDVIALSDGSKLVASGNSADSYVVRALEGEPTAVEMPPKGPLTLEQIQLVKDWIDAGAAP